MTSSTKRNLCYQLMYHFDFTVQLILQQNYDKYIYWETLAFDLSSIKRHGTRQIPPL